MISATCVRVKKRKKTQTAESERNGFVFSIAGLPAVVNIIPSKSGLVYEGIILEEFLKQLEDAGAAAVGFNCSFGPATIVDPMKKARKVCKVEMLYVVTLRINRQSVSKLSFQKCYCKASETFKINYRVQCLAYLCHTERVQKDLPCKRL